MRGRFHATRGTADKDISFDRARVCFHASRTRARLADDGSLLLMPEQDRSQWDSALVSEGFASLTQAGAGTELSRFHIEAGIAACHAIATSYTTTDWPRIVDLHELLRECAPSLIVDVNRALAVAMCSGARAGIDELDAIPEREILARYPYALAAYSDLHASLGNINEARAYLERALTHQSSPAQHALLSANMPRSRPTVPPHADPVIRAMRPTCRRGRRHIGHGILGRSRAA
jgi:RNA polymerase sigma-70 factor (ECF subfamily)